LGGLAAANILYGRPKKQKLYGVYEDIPKKYGAFGDMEKAQSLCQKYYNDQQCQEIIDSSLKEAVKTLERKWTAVEALAAALIDKRKLTGKEAFKIIKEAGN